MTGSYTKVSRECFLGGSHICDDKGCQCGCHTNPAKVAVYLNDKELRKIEHILRMKARYQEKRTDRRHQAEAAYFHDLADKLERARLGV